MGPQGCRHPAVGCPSPRGRIRQVLQVLSLPWHDYMTACSLKLHALQADRGVVQHISVS